MIQADKVQEPPTCLDLVKTPPKEAGASGSPPLFLSADSITLDSNPADKKIIWAFLKANGSNPLDPNDLLLFRLTQECDETKSDQAGLMIKAASDGKDKPSDCDPTKVPAGGPALREYAMGASMTGGSSGVACQKGDANTETKEIFEIGTVTLVGSGTKPPDVEAVFGLDMGTAAGKYRVTIATANKKKDKEKEWILSRTFEVHPPAPPPAPNSP